MPARKRKEKADYFAQNEIAHASDLSPEDRDQLVSAINRCREASRDIWQFTSWPLRTQAALLPAYELFLLILDLGDPAIDDLASHPFFRQGRRRKLSRNKPALMVVHLALCPRDQRQRNLCSSWVPLVESFAKRGVAPENFQAELSRTNLRTCTEELRAERRREREPAPDDQSTADENDCEQTEPSVEELDGVHVGLERSDQFRNDPGKLSCPAEHEVGRGRAEITLEVAICLGPHRVVSKRSISRETSEAIQDVIDRRPLDALNASTLEQIGKILREFDSQEHRRTSTKNDRLRTLSGARPN